MSEAGRQQSKSATLWQHTTLPQYNGMTAFCGDIHNHCGISYGHGTLEEAYFNARLQLDFASVTGHANWHDMPSEPSTVARYHQQGFRRLQNQWMDVQEVTEAVNEEGSFVSLLSFEWHSMRYGDQCVYYRGGRGPLEAAYAKTLSELRAALRRISAAGLPAMVLPHHIGYLAGRRGVVWDAFTEEFSPVVELISMHGSGEYDAAPRPYLHTMGPRDARSTAIAGLRAGHRFGFIGSTDHHSAHPGSYGYGRAMVWAEELTRDSLWEAIQSRRTYAVTGDRIMLATAVNGVPMGSVATGGGSRRVEVDVRGGSSIDVVELVRNGDVVARTSARQVASDRFSGVLSFAMGWGEVGVPIEWDVDLELIGGRILALEPRLRGYDVVAPAETEPEVFQFSRWEQTGPCRLRIQTRTTGNPTVVTDGAQRFALRVEGDLRTRLVVRANGFQFPHTIGELLGGPRVGYIGGFLSGALVVDRAIPDESLKVEWNVKDKGTGSPGDWYYVRVRQHNEQLAWSSPTWLCD